MKGIKVTIPETQKVVVLREPVIEDQEIAAQSVSGQSGGDQFVFILMMNKAMLRQLIYSIDDKVISAKDSLRLGDLLTLQEYNRLLQVVGKLTGNESPLAPVIESVNFGDK